MIIDNQVNGGVGDGFEIPAECRWKTQIKSEKAVIIV